MIGLITKLKQLSFSGSFVITIRPQVKQDFSTAVILSFCRLINIFVLKYEHFKDVLPYNCSGQVKQTNVSLASLQIYTFGRPPSCYTSLQEIKKYSSWVSFKIVMFTPSFVEIGSMFQNRSLVICSLMHYDHLINYLIFMNQCRLYKCSSTRWTSKISCKPGSASTEKVSGTLCCRTLSEDW